MKYHDKESSIKIKKERGDFSSLPLEHCCFCDSPTEFWALDGQVPVCKTCVKRHEPCELPIK